MFMALFNRKKIIFDSGVSIDYYNLKLINQTLLKYICVQVTNFDLCYSSVGGSSVWLPSLSLILSGDAPGGQRASLPAGFKGSLMYDFPRWGPRLAVFALAAG